jgi:GntR family transcriptional regulator
MPESAIQLTQRGDGVPLYVRLAGTLRARISQGEWAVGARIPAFEELSATYGVAMNTVRKAVELLANEGVLASGRGRGTTVASSEARVLEGALLQEMYNPLADSQQLEINVLRCERHATPPPALLKTYQAAPSYVRIVKTHSVRGMAYGLLDIYVETAAFDRFPPGSLERRKVTRLLKDFGPSDVLQTRQQLTIAYADDALASMLRCQPASALMRVRRWKIASDERLALTCEIFYRGDTFIWDSTEDEHHALSIVPETPQDDPVAG